MYISITTESARRLAASTVPGCKPEFHMTSNVNVQRVVSGETSPQTR